MARDDDGAPAPGVPGQVYLPAWRRAYDRLVKMLRQAYAQAEELSVEREHLISELQFLQSASRERQEISQVRLQQIHCHQKLAELAESDLENFKSCISNLAAENTELKEKLKMVESQVQISTDNSDHEKSGKYTKEELQKLKKAYKTMRSEKDKEISALQAEKNFVWNQLKNMEKDYTGTIKSKHIEVKQATEAAQKLLQNVDELQAAAQKKDGEIDKLQIEVSNAKQRISILEDELQNLRSLVKDKDHKTGKNEDGEPETRRMLKKDANKANRKSKSEWLPLEDISRTSQVTPDRREVKTTRALASETNQKRKRSSFKSSMSCGNQRCYTRLLQVKAAVSPVLLPPSFTVPRLKTPPPPQSDEITSSCSLMC
ncbi:cytomatrix protein-related [Zea mays]|uniref:Cytomatrix protein-related n=1 Tax=Zea mays TaxID=4577 RepID=A0A1D6MHP5_MAIZE|nr:cytomatrix protein-related [Zea mays]